MARIVANLVVRPPASFALHAVTAHNVGLAFELACAHAGLLVQLAGIEREIEPHSIPGAGPDG